MNWIRSHPRRVAAAAVALVLLLWLIARSGSAESTGTTFVARRGPLDITVLNGGSIEALESLQIRSEVRGEPVKILKLVEEGYTVTEDDVRTNKLLAELDSSKLQQNLVERDVTFQSTLASLTQAQQDYEIQLNQSRLDIRTAEQDAKFAFLDLEKYLGDRITAELIERLDLRDHGGGSNAVPILAAVESQATNAAPSDTVQTAMPSPAEPQRIAVNFSQYARAELLGDGAARQELRKREDEVLVAKTELSQAQTKLGGTRRLHEKEFVTKSELEAEEINTDKARLKLESADTALNLFIRYEFPKLAEETLLKYDKALRTLDRTRKEAVSKFAQKRASLKGAEGRYQIEKRHREELNEQIAKCTLTATKPGMIVYGGGDEDMYWGGRDPIRVGSQVFERQVILTVPDTTQMGVKLGIHESHIKKVSKGLTARIKVDAFPDDPLEGEVTKVGVLPDSRNRWMNPDLKLYQCTIAIKASRPWLKPGMSTKVEILVKRLEDVVYVPVQAVSMADGRQVVYQPGSRPKPREVEIGEFNDEFIEIRKGLAVGDRVLLRVPDSERKAGEEKKPGTEPKQTAAATGAPL
jgi:HlyD family secretion protein